MDARGLDGFDQGEGRQEGGEVEGFRAAYTLL